MPKTAKSDMEIVKAKYPQAVVKSKDGMVWIESAPDAFGPRVSAEYRVVMTGEVAEANAWASAAHWITEDEKRAQRHAQVRLADKAISHKVVRTLLAAGFSITIDNGGSEDGAFEIVKSNNAKAIFQALAATDEDYIKPHKDGKYHGYVRLIYGESGWDVICDYTTNLEEFVGEGSAVEKVRSYWEEHLCG